MSAFTIIGSSWFLHSECWHGKCLIYSDQDVIIFSHTLHWKSEIEKTNSQEGPVYDG